MNMLDIVNWLYGEADRLERIERDKQQQDQYNYGQPSRHNKY